MSLYHRTTPNARHNGTNRNNNNDNKKALAVGSLCCCATVLVVVLTAALLNGLLYSAAVRRRVLGSERVFPFLAPQALPQPSPPPGMDLAHPPPGSIYLGASVDWDAGDTPAAFNRRMGLPVTVFQHFMNVTSSLNGTEVTDLQYIVGAVRAAGSRWLALTMMPAAGLDAITDRGVDQIGRVCAAINSAAGVRVLLRWAHEMNGNWYQYGQVPRRYIDMWKRVTLSVRRYTNQTAMVWAPNSPQGYPWWQPGDASEVLASSDEFAALDTNCDGKIDALDDPYSPYWPGNAFVDWIGISSFFFGAPGGQLNDNAIPPPTAFADSLEYRVPSHNATTWSIQQMAVAHGKPLAIMETAAAYYPFAVTKASELDIKQAWWQQIYAPAVLARFDRIRLVCWFDVRKRERVSAARGMPAAWVDRDFRISHNSTIRKAWVAAVTAVDAAAAPPGDS